MSKNRQRVSIVILLACLLFSSPAHAYNDRSTHPALTQEIIRLYNQNNPQGSITSEEMEWIIQGSVLEDTPPRWINHFYDPVNETGWTGSDAGNLDAETIRQLSLVGLSSERPVSAPNWVTNYQLQEKYALYGGNRSWKRGLEYYADGDKKEAYITLGHILHILEDMGVPDHTRDDTHAQVVEQITGDNGSPYEGYATRWHRQNIQMAGLDSIPVPSYSNVTEYIKNVASYSNKYFFSKDTISNKYPSPRPVEDAGGLGYGLDENKTRFALVKISLVKKEGLDMKKIYILERNDSQIFDAYFSRLSKQVVLNGAGVIRLFKSQAEDALVNKEFPTRLVDLRPDIKRFQLPAFSLFGLTNKIVGLGSGLVATITGLFTSEENSSPTDINQSDISSSENYQALTPEGVSLEDTANQSQPISPGPEILKQEQELVTENNGAANGTTNQEPENVPIEQSLAIDSPTTTPTTSPSTATNTQDNVDQKSPSLPPPPVFGGVSFTPAPDPSLPEDTPDQENDPPPDEDPAPLSGPPIRNFSARYSSSTMSAILSWDTSDGVGSTSTYTYRINQIATDSSPTLKLESETSTSYSQQVDRETRFEFSVTDSNGSSTATTTTVSSDFYARPGIIFEQGTKEIHIESGPGILKPGNTVLLRVFQTFTPQRTGQLDQVDINWSFAQPTIACEVRLYRTDDPNGMGDSTLMATSSSGAGCTAETAGEHSFHFSPSTIQAGSAYLFFMEYLIDHSQPTLWGASDAVRGSYWQTDGTSRTDKDIYLKISGTVMSADIGAKSPGAPQGLTATFDPNNISANISWSASSDADSSVSDLIYQIQATTSNALSDSNPDWQTIGNALSTSTRAYYPNTYLIGVRTRDEYYNYSPVATTTFSFPADFNPNDILASQTDANQGVVASNGQDGTRTNMFGQTFTVASSSTPQSLTISTIWTGDNATCSIKIYRAGSIAETNDSNLIAASDAMSGCGGEENKIFYFNHTGPLQPGTTYIWTYSVSNGSFPQDGLIGGYKAEAYPNTLSTQNSTMGQEYNAYFVLKGDLQ